MLSIVMLAVSLTGCGKWLPVGFPEPPKIEAEHLIVIQNDKAYCFKLNIESYIPKKLAQPISVPLSECNELGGVLPDEAVKIDNWVEKVYRWGKENKCYQN